MTLISNLNPQQIRAVTLVHGPVLVLAGPGSGKTRVLTRRIAHMIDEAGIAPWNILAVTFTNKAAREMRERVEKLLEEKFGPPLPGHAPRLGGLTIGTFHSICARVLRVETAAIGYAPNWVIYDSGDQHALVRNILREMNLDEKRYSPNAIHARISNQKNELITPENYRAQNYFEEVAGRVYTRYQEALRINNAVDFDDLLMKTVLLFREREDLLRKYQQKWQYMLVDEFQDTNTAQYALLRLLANGPEGKRNLFVVGDEDQSVYKFRGADYHNVQNFMQDYPEATKILLEQNYRSTQKILDVANAVISRNRNRTPKRLHTENGPGLAVTIYEAYNEIEEAGYICDELERLMANGGFTLSDFAVMYRTNAQSRALEEAFVLRQIKYKLVGGTRFYERKEVKDALSYLRVVHNPADTIALDRIINEPARGIGPKTYGAIKLWAASMGVNEYTALSILLYGPAAVMQRRGITLPTTAYTAPDLGNRAVNALTQFAKMLEGWILMREMARYGSVAELFDTIMQDSGYAAALRDGTDEGEDRFANLQELRGVAAQYMHGFTTEAEQTPLAMFLEEVSLVSDSDQIEEGNGAVTLLTLHTAKGLEYPVVFIVGMEDGILPHKRSLESEDPEDMAEERRLCYVGITRAKRRLYLVHAFRRSLWGSSEVQQPSRFLDEIPTELLTGMVDKRGRREASYQRATSWDDDDTVERKPPSRSGQPKNPYTWNSAAGASGEAGKAKSTYWSPGADSGAKITRPAPSVKGAGSTRLPEFTRRDSVQHKTFGVGTVIESNLTRDDEEVTIAFPGVGIKKLLVSLAGLKKL
ncbi:UvrD-helicase domain-containing protein [soil metagenome]